MYLLVNVNLDIFAGRSGKINFFKDSKGTQTHGYIFLDNSTAITANTTSALVFARSNNTLIGSISGNSYGLLIKGTCALSIMQITDFGLINMSPSTVQINADIINYNNS